MIKQVLKRFTSLLLTLILIMSFIEYFPQDIFAYEIPSSASNIVDSTSSLGTDDVYVYTEKELEDSQSVAEVKAAGDDPLQSVAIVTTGGDVSSYVEIDSAYTPSGYTTRSTGTSAYTSTPGNDFSYHTSRNGRTSNSYIITPTSDLLWAKNSDSTGITGTLSYTAVSDYKSCGENGALCAKVNSKAIQIYALEDINITFDFSSNLTIDKSAGQGNIMEGVYTLKTTSTTPTVAQIKAGTVRSNTVLTDLSKTVSSTDSVSESLQQGEYLYIYFYGFFNNQSSGDVDTTNYTYTANVTDFKITPVTENYSLTIGNSDCADNLVGGGKITVNGTAVNIPSSGTAVGLSDALSGTSVTLSVNTVPSGYFHIGWRINGADVFEKNYEMSLNADTTAYALYVPEVTVIMGSNGYSDATYSYKTPSGTTVSSADQYIARNSNATIYYKTLNEAFSANAVVVLLGNIVLNGDFTIPNGKTLSVQRDWTDPATSDLQNLAESAAMSIFAKATINGTVTVQGNLVASGVQGTDDGVNGRATGGVGQLLINGTVNVVSGGKLCAYGMITGPGQVNVASGGIVRELMEVRDMRSVYVLPTVASGGALLFNSYFVKTNEVSTTYSNGSNLIAHYYVSISGIKSGGNVTVIGPSNALFNLNSGSLTKTFSSASPYNNKTIFRAESGSDIQSGKFSITVKASGFSGTIDTSSYELPINYCMAIEVMSGGSMTLNYDHKLLPGALVDVKEGGTLTIASGKKLVLYRANDYGFSGAFTASSYPTSFTRPIGLSYPSNTAANVGSAKLNVDGTLNAVGGLYVTDQDRGKTAYSNGYNYLTGTGTINITGSQSNGTIKEWIQPEGNSASSVNVAYVPIKGITNYDAATDDGQTDYNSLSSGTWYGYINDNNVNVWSKDAPVTLSYSANGGTGDAPASTRKPSGIAHTIAANTFSTPEGMEFNGWNTQADGNGTAYEAGTNIVLTESTILYAQWKQLVCETHTAGEAVEEKRVEATCTAAGHYDSVVYCTVCGEEISRTEVEIPALGHDWGDWIVTTAATCEEDGLEKRICSHDSTHVETRVVPATGHTVVVDAAVAATCTQTGFTEGSHCSVCDKVLVAQEVVPVLGHDWAEITYTWSENNSSVTALKACNRDHGHDVTETASVVSSITTEPGCESDGVRTYTAVFENEWFETQTKTETISALGHTAGEAVRENEAAATCEGEGSYDLVVYCSVCGKELSREHVTVEVLGHAWGEATYTWADDNSKVTARRECLREGCDHYETETVDTESAVAQAATCTQMGKTTYTATFTNEAFVKQSKTVEDIPLAEHTAVVDTAVAATCTETGLTEGCHCSVCGEVLVAQEVVPALGHDWGDWAVTTNATCTEDGIETRECRRDHSHVETRAIPALGHTAGEAVRENEVAATCTAAGHYDSVVYCNVCGEKVSRTEVEIPATGHTVVVDTAVAATCTETGLTEGNHCSVCGEVLVAQEIAPALGHDWAEITYTWSEDNLSVTALKACSRDHSHDVKETALAESIIITDPGCESTGVRKYTAVFENEEFGTQTKTEIISALGHSAGEAVEENRVEATCTAAGHYDSVVYCTVCGEEISRTVAEIPALDHDWVITYNWDYDQNLVTAHAECSRDDSHMVDDVAVITTQVTQEPTCEDDGIKTYTASFMKAPFIEQTKSESIPALGHVWKDAVYTWASDLGSVTATRVCSRDESHIETETAYVAYSIVKDPTDTEDGIVRYTAAFSNPAFETQEKDVALPLQSVTSISMNTYPKTVYFRGENLDVSNGSILVEFENGQSVVPLTVSMISGYDPYALGTQTLTVTYGGAVTSFEVELIRRDVIVEKVGISTTTYTVSGNIVTVRYDLPCRLGYISEGKYITIKASDNGDGSYYFVVPDDIERVTLVVIGDVDQDGNVSVEDCEKIRRYVLERESLDTLQMFAGDVDRDGEVALADSTKMKSWLSGIEASFWDWDL